MKVVMIPWLAYGHITPFLELAKKLAKRNFQIFVCSTPINLKSIQKRITQEYSVSITLVEFHLPSTPQLPPHYHTTNGLPSHLNDALGTALDTAGPNLISNILKTLTPDLVIYDIIRPWVQTVASSSNIPAVGFITHGASLACCCLQMSPQQSEICGDPQFSQHYRDVLQKSFKILMCNTFRGIEGKYIDCLTGLLDKKIVPAGFLVEEEEEAATAMDAIEDEEETNILRWLGEKEDSSTVFVSFGSECYLSKQEIEEIAHGLELSKVNFIWVVRFPHHDHDGGEENKTATTTSSIQEALPEGFLQRVCDRGLVVEGWAPQAKILAHPSTGGFVSHCGWNSTMESLRYGVPVIAVPMQLDQPLNAKLLVEVGTAAEVKRSEDGDGTLDRQDIAQAIRKIVVDKSGEELRIKAREFSKIANMGGEKQIDDLVQELTQLIQTTNFI